MRRHIVLTGGFLQGALDVRADPLEAVLLSGTAVCRCVVVLASHMWETFDEATPSQLHIKHNNTHING